MRAETRLWRTADGRLVADGDQDAATLAYTPGDDIAPADEAKLPGTTKPETGPKAAATPANKAAKRPADKGA